jgi:sec-independent protein translocase protein TatA
MIPGFPSIGGGELLILLAIILLFFGAKRIPDLARSLGKGTREFRKGISEGATEDETQEEGKMEDEEKLSSERIAADGKPLNVEAEITHAEQKS